MRRIVFALLLLAACGGPTRDAAEVTIPAQGTPPPPVAPPAPVGPLDVTMPAYAAATLVLDPSLVTRAARGLFTHADGSASNEQRDLEEDLGVGKGALAPDRLLDTLGVDGSRPIAIAIARIDAAEHPRVPRLEALAAKVKRTPGDGARIEYGELVAAFGTEPALARLRARVPIKDSAVAKRALRHLFTKAGLRESGPPPGVDLVMSSRKVTIAASSDSTWLVVDVYLRDGGTDAPRPDVLASIHRLRAEGERGSEPSPLDRDAARAEWEPGKLAELAFVNGVQTTMQALVNVDPEMKGRIAAAGLIEAHRNIELAGNERGNYFTRVTLSMAGPDHRGPLLSAKGEFGAGFEATARAASHAPGSASFKVGKVHSYLDASLASGLAFPMPGDGASGPADEQVLTRTIREAGWAGWFIAAPLVPLYLMTIPVRPPPNAFNPRSAALKLERVAIVEPEQHRGELFVGLLRAGTSDAEAACVLSGTIPCSSHVLQVNGPAFKMGDKFARVSKSGDRFIVIVGDEAARVDAFKPTVVHGEPTPLWAQLPSDAFRGPQAALLFGTRDPPQVGFVGTNSGDSFELIADAK